MLHIYFDHHPILPNTNPYRKSGIVLGLALIMKSALRSLLNAGAEVFVGLLPLLFPQS